MLLSGLKEVDRALVEIQKQIDALKLPAILRGNLLIGISITTTATPIAHRLGRKIQGYIVVGSTVLTEFADENAGKSDLDRFTYLKAGAATTVNLWCF